MLAISITSFESALKVLPLIYQVQMLMESYYVLLLLVNINVIFLDLL